MRPLLALFLLTGAALAQSAPQVQTSHTTEALRGVSAVSRKVAWASGTHGTYLRTTDASPRWTPAQVPDAESLDLRAVVAFSADEAFLMSAGPGDQSRIYHTNDAGQHWLLQFTNPNPKGFFDSMAFWDAKHGVVLGDPIPDESGKLKFELLLTDDGQTWRQIPPANLPPAEEGEGAFAASNTCIAILPTSSKSESPQSPEKPKPDVIPNARQRERDHTSPSSIDTVDGIAPPPAPPWKSGASAPRKLSEKDGVSTPEHDSDNSLWVAQRFSAAMKDSLAAGASAPGVTTPTSDPNIWFATGGKVARVFHSPDRGRTWQVFNTPITHGPDSAGIFSIAFLDATHGVIAGGDYKHPNQDGPNLAFTADGGKTWTLSPIHPQAYFSAAAYDRKYLNRERLFIVGTDFIFDFRPPSNPTRISPRRHSAIKFNAITAYPEGGAIAVGPKGSIAILP